MKYPEVVYEAENPMTMDAAWSYLTHLQRKHGVKSTVRFGENKIIVQPTKMAKVRCPTCNSIAGVKADGTLAHHSFRDRRGFYNKCADIGKGYKKPV